MSFFGNKTSYLGNPNLKAAGVKVQLTAEQIEEYAKCMEDPAYFVEKYVRFVTLNKGFVNIELYDFQRKAMQKFKDERKIILKAGRQVGKTTIVAGFILWFIIFNFDQTVAILANKASTSREILARIKLAYESLPLWIQQGVKTWNKGDIELDNKSRVLASSTSSSAIRGYTISLLYLDEFAFVPTNVAEEFFTSVYPTISSGDNSKVLISSTPNGMNHFYKMWTDAEQGNNGFTHIIANWREVPGRDQKWADDQLRVLGEQKFMQEMECVAGDTIVTVKNLITGKIEKVRVDSLYNRDWIYETTKIQEVKPNREYQVLTPSGWSDFSSIKKKPVSTTLLIMFDDETSIQCTENHLLKVEGRFIEAEWVAVGQKISGKTVTSVEYVYGEVEVYDLVNVELNNEYITNDVVSHNCEFIGSVGTLISGRVLKSLAFVSPTINSGINNLKIYQAAIPNHTYVITVDTSRGQSLDYSAFVVIDITQMPYRVVATYKDNEISPLVYPTVLSQVGLHYNKAYQLIEINDIGQQISDILFEEYDYEGLICTANMGKALNKKLVATFGIGDKSGRGIRTTKSVKRLGCSLLKNLIERYQLIIEDYDIISELSTFVANSNSYEAEPGSHDDLVMCLVLFAWLTNQKLFIEIANTDVRKKLNEDVSRQLEDDFLPDILAGHIDIDQADQIGQTYVEDGVMWSVVDKRPY